MTSKCDKTSCAMHCSASGECKVLYTSYGKKKCPFFKTRDQLNADKKWVKDYYNYEN